VVKGDTGRFGRALLLAATTASFYGCAQIAGIKDREKEEGQGSGGAGGSGTGGGGGVGDCTPRDSGDPSVPDTLATGEDGPRAIVVDGTSIYWINDGRMADLRAIRRRSKQGGAPSDLAVTSKIPQALADDETYVYWGSSRGENVSCDPGSPDLLSKDEVRRVRKESGPAGTGGGGGGETGAGDLLWSGCGKPEGLAVDGTRIFMARPNANRVQVIDKSNGGIVTLVNDEAREPWGITSSERFLHWTDHITKDITAYSKTSEMKSLAVKPGDPIDEIPMWITSDEANIYWLTEHHLLRKALEPATAKPVVLLCGLIQPGGLAVYGDYVYVTDASASKVTRVHKEKPGDATILAKNQSEPLGIDADETGVYWVNHGTGEVMRLPLSP
jgi:hypothetical protein